MNTTSTLALDYKTAEFEVGGAYPMRMRLGLDSGVAVWLDRLDAHVAFVIIPSGNPATMPTAEAPGASLRWLLDMLKRTRLQWELARARVPGSDDEVMDGVCVFDVPFALVDEWLLWLDQDAAVQASGSGYVMLRSHPAIRSRRGFD